MIYLCILNYLENNITLLFLTMIYIILSKHYEHILTILI